MTTTNEKQPDYVDCYVGARIRARRNQIDISQQELAEGLGVTFQQVQKYERGANRISASMLVRAAKTMKVPVSFFFENVPDGPPETAPDADPIMVAASQLYEDARRRVKGRPKWIDLNLDDPYDAAMHAFAVDLAKSQARQSD